MLTLRIAFKNLLGAGLRTWLNVVVLSLSYIVIVFYNSMMDGWNKQAMTDTIAWEIGEGQIWEADYDPFDPYTLIDAHSALPAGLSTAVEQDRAVPVLIVQAAIYPQGRLQNILLKGIPAGQQLLELPTSAFDSLPDVTPAIIGRRMAAATKLREGDRVLLRWRDKNGTFDAREIAVARVFDNNVPGIDNGQIWIPLREMYEMTGMHGEATLLVAGPELESPRLEGWEFKSREFLLADLKAIIEAKKGSAAIMYLMLLGIALLAVFDTQVLSIFRRQKEIGTYIALGMTRGQVVRLFTVEGAAHSLLAAGLAVLYGTPLFWYLKKHGIPMPPGSDSAGLPVSSEVIPVYGAGLIIGTILLVVLSATVVSYLPARKIARMKPTEALKGKIQ